jgi:flagellar basal body rod protein FlgB
MKSELEEPLNAFAGGMKERRKIVQTGIERLLKTKQAQTAHVNKSRDKYEQDCLRIKGYLAQGHMVMGQEERKNKAKLEKTQINMASNSNEYEAAVKVLEESIGRWNKEWKAACDVSRPHGAIGTISNNAAEIPGSRGRAHRLHKGVFMVFRQHRFNRLCIR